jgi:hypothetical protein
MRRVLALVSVAALATAVGIFVSSASAVSLAQNSTIATFSDSVGEVAGGPDIGIVTVSLDGAVLTVEGNVAGMPDVLSDGAVMFLLNTDSSQATGSMHGADYVLFMDMKTLQGSVLHWNGSDYVAADKVADPSRTLISGGSAGFMFNLANLGSPTHIEFAMVVVKGSTESGLIDVAPDSGLWAFDTIVAPAPPPAPTPTPAVVKPVFGTATTIPAKPTAGKKVVFTLAVKRSDTGAPLTTGKMICDPSYKGIVIKHAESFKGGTAKLVFMVPKAAKGKTLKVKVTIVNGKQSATRVVAYKVA